MVPDAINTAGGAVLETKIVASEVPLVDIGGGVTANLEVYNGAIPGPTLRLNKDDAVIVRLVNNLPHPTGIHWHGIELANAADGTPVTQDAAQGGPGAPGTTLAGGTYLYKFKVPRPGIYWYHPHFHHSTNRVFRGLYGMIIVADPNEATLIANGIIPGAADTRQLVLSDITVCKTVGANDTATYGPTLPFLSAVHVQPAPTPADLCELNPLDEDGNLATVAFAAGDVPNIQRADTGRTNEGQTVLTNGVNVGARSGSPSAPGALAAGAVTLPVQAGQGIRFQIVNCATIRYFRLRLTTSDGTLVPLVRIGGEGGLLDNAVVEGGIVAGFDTKYDSGEILLPPASRADVVAAVPATATGVLTLWTQDYQRTGAGYSIIPTVPVAHLEVTGSVTPFSIAAGVPLRSSIMGQAVTPLAGPFATLPDPQNPTVFSPTKPGTPNPEITLTVAGPAGPIGIDGISEPSIVHGPGPYTARLHFQTARYAQRNNTLELKVTNTTNAHHPFHLHGFSFQPISLTRPSNPTYTWPYREFRDNVDIPSGYSLTFRVRLDDRPLVDGMTMGGALGRWLFHCHIFFHEHHGMVSELVVAAADGSEKPTVDVGGSWAYAPVGGIATRHGSYHHPDGDPVSLTASLGTLTYGGGTWQWSYTGAAALTQYVYITATDSSGRQDQTVFRLKIGGPDDGSDNGDPHIHTVDGGRYDFQAVGEFVLLRDRDGMEVQTRQTPVLTANPVTDSYTGLRSCVSVNTAVAARVGTHSIAYQPAPPSGQVSSAVDSQPAMLSTKATDRQELGEFQLYLDGQPIQLTAAGFDLDGHRVSAFDADGATGLRVDYAHHAVILAIPYFWASQGVWLLNVSVSHTHADEGLMGPIAGGSWLPALPEGSTLGPMPASLADRHVALYRTFANAWRVGNQTSLFVYAPGTSTGTFTDQDWPALELPCVLKPQFATSGVVVLAGIDIAQAREICQAVTDPDLQRDCVFDVATTGDPVFARAYELTQHLRDRACAVQVTANQPCPGPGGPAGIRATVLPLRSGRPVPKGQVTFIVDGVRVDPPVRLDGQGRACLAMSRLKPGDRRIQATFTPDQGPGSYHASTSPALPAQVQPQQVVGLSAMYANKSIWWLPLLLILMLVAVVCLFTVL